MSEGSWIFGVICGIIISLATVPYAVCYARYDNFELHDAYISEVKQTIPIAIREYLKNKPWDSFFIKIFKAQSATEDLASKIAEHIVESMVREEGEVYCYLQMYLNVVRPDLFQQIYIQPIVGTLNEMRSNL
jgi:hypothetical protein